MVRNIFQLLAVAGAIVLLLSSCSSDFTSSGYSGSSSGSSGNSGSNSSSSGSSGNSGSPGKSGSSGYSGGTPSWGVQQKTSGCTVNGKMQDIACTPGDVIKSATKAQICVPGYAGKTRNVPQSVKNQAYAEYGITSHKAGQYEVDHLVSLELGGSNDISNLWPEAASPKPGFHEKDRVETYLHNQMCSGAISLQQAQIEIATNWLAVYNSMPSNNKSGGGDGDGSA